MSIFAEISCPHFTNAQAEVLNLSLLGLKYEEISSLTGVNLDSVHRRIFKHHYKHGYERNTDLLVVLLKCDRTFRENFKSQMSELLPPLDRETREFPKISEKEREVVLSLFSDTAARAVGEKMHINERTVNSHLGHLYARFDVCNKIELLGRLLSMGLIVVRDD